MCEDCQSNAEEYAELYTRQKAYLHKAQQELEAAQRALKLAERSRDDYKRVLELGVAPQMLAWMRSLSPSAFRKAIEREVAEL
jgi:hypothetical protein